MASELLDRIAVLVIATDGRAGVGSLIDWGGRPLLEQVIGDVEQWGADDIYVVLGCDDQEILDRVAFGTASVVVDPEWEEGEVSSIRVGLDALTRQMRHDAALLIRGNEPGVPPTVAAAVVDRYRMTRASVVVPTYRYAPGPPTLVDASLWDRLMGMTGDAKLTDLIRAHPEWVEEAWVDQQPHRRLTTELDVADLKPRH